MTCRDRLHNGSMEKSDLRLEFVEQINKVLLWSDKNFRALAEENKYLRDSLSCTNHQLSRLMSNMQGFMEHSTSLMPEKGLVISNLSVFINNKGEINDLERGKLVDCILL